MFLANSGYLIYNVRIFEGFTLRVCVHRETRDIQEKKDCQEIQ